MQRFPHLAQKLFNTPLMLHPQKAEVVMAALADRFGITSLITGAEGFPPPAQNALRAAEAMFDYDKAGFDLTPEGIAVIGVEGTLVQKLGHMRPFSGMTGYDGIGECFRLAGADKNIPAIIAHLDSPGGEVAGCFDLADTISSVAAVKPVWAILDECAYSGAYALASACTRITVPRTGGAGSIGVIAMLTDLSGALSKAGVKVNIIQYGAHKADGNEFEPLPEAARARFQAQIDTLGTLFVETVARNRGLTAEAVRATEAATFLADEALALGLVDAVMSRQEAYDALLASL